MNKLGDLDRLEPRQAIIRITAWAKTIENVITGLIKTNLIDGNDTPYQLLSSDNVLFCDTDNKAMTVLLPLGVDGKEYRIVNTGSTAKDVTLLPKDLELLLGLNSSVALTPGDVLIIVFRTKTGWW